MRGAHVTNPRALERSSWSSRCLYIESSRLTCARSFVLAALIHRIVGEHSKFLFSDILIIYPVIDYSGIISQNLGGQGDLGKSQARLCVDLSMGSTPSVDRGTVWRVSPSHVHRHLLPQFGSTTESDDGWTVFCA